MEGPHNQNSKEQSQPSQEGVVRVNKERIWNEKLARVEQLTDGRGYGIDEGIKDTVTTLQVLGINTTGSHEGKMERNPVPYIDIESPEVYELVEKAKSLTPEQKSEGEKLNNEIIRRNLEERKKIIQYLEEFYANRKVPYEVRLGIHSFARCWSRLQSQGADFQKVEQNEEIKKQRLQQFQEEMSAFTDFLKKRFFEE